MQLTLNFFRLTFSEISSVAHGFAITKLEKRPKDKQDEKFTTIFIQNNLTIATTARSRKYEN